MSCNSVSVANPSIDGIGIRISMYAHAVLALLPIGISLLAKDFNEDGFQKDLANDIQMNATAILATGCALLIVSFIQAGQQSLDLYDAIIVLELSWLNNLTAAFPTLLRHVLQDEDSISRRKSFWWRRLGTYHLHCTLTGSFGILLFHDIQSWSPGCAGEYYLLFCGRPFQASGRGVQIAVLVVSAMAVTPVLNVFGMFLIIKSLCTIEQALCGFRRNHPPVLALLAWGVPSLLMVVSTEQFIAYNSAMVSGSANQGEWSFGQILSLLLLFLPVWTAADRIVTLYRIGAPAKNLINEEEDIPMLPQSGPPGGTIAMSTRPPSYVELPQQYRPGSVLSSGRRMGRRS